MDTLNSEYISTCPGNMKYIFRAFKYKNNDRQSPYFTKIRNAFIKLIRLGNPAFTITTNKGGLLNLECPAGIMKCTVYFNKLHNTNCYSIKLCCTDAVRAYFTNPVYMYSFHYTHDMCEFIYLFVDVHIENIFKLIYDERYLLEASPLPKDLSKIIYSYLFFMYKL